MKFIVTDNQAKKISTHRKWQVAIEKISKLANKHRNTSPKKYFLIALEKSGERWLFASAIYVPRLGAGSGSGSVRTDFTDKSIPIRYQVIDPVDRIPHN